MASLVFHTVVDFVVHRYNRRIVVEEVVSIRMVAEGEEAVDEEVVDSHNRIVAEAAHSFEVDNRLAGVGTPVVEVLRILRCIQVLGILTFLLSYEVGVRRSE